VRREIKLESKKWRYRIDVAYPEIQGLPYRRSRVLNREIRALLKKAYRWPMLLETRRHLLRGKYLRNDKIWNGVFNTVDLEYDIVQAGDEILSIYFIGYHYGIGGAHSVHESFTVNYDLETHQLLILTSLFRSKSQSLKLISRKCIVALSDNPPYLSRESIWVDNLKPKRENFESWNITSRGLRLNFDACRVAGCADGDIDVEIPFEELKEMSRPGSLLNKIADNSGN
jgi:hypothetical protein